MDTQVEKLFSRDDVAEVLGCSGRHVDNLIKDRGFPRGLHVGVLRRWRPETVYQWIEEQEVQQAVPA